MEINFFAPGNILIFQLLSTSTVQLRLTRSYHLLFALSVFNYFNRQSNWKSVDGSSQYRRIREMHDYGSCAMLTSSVNNFLPRLIGHDSAYLLLASLKELNALIIQYIQRAHIFDANWNELTRPTIPKDRYHISTVSSKNTSPRELISHRFHIRS